MADSPENPDQQPVERLQDHLDVVSQRPDEMQERLDDLGDDIEAARRQAEADDLLPPGEGEPASDEAFEKLGMPQGDPARETPVNDSDVPPTG